MRTEFLNEMYSNISDRKEPYTKPVQTQPIFPKSKTIRHPVTTKYEVLNDATATNI